MIIEIRAGTGGKDAQDLINEMVNLYAKAAASECF